MAAHSKSALVRCAASGALRECGALVVIPSPAWSTNCCPRSWARGLARRCAIRRRWTLSATCGRSSRHGSIGSPPVVGEDFEVQRKLLERAQAKLADLERRIAELESRGHSQRPR